MKEKIKITYLKILLNVKDNAYKNNNELLKQDLIKLKRIIQIYQGEKSKMKKLEKILQKKLTKSY